MNELRAERLEAMGQLSSGIAHDMNNILGVIQTYASLVLTALDADEDHALIAQDVSQILNAAQSGADLTGQLLTFARHDVREPEKVSVSTLIGHLQEMLSRIIREDIPFVVKLDSPPYWLVLADPGQLEQIVMNTVVNARQAHASEITLCVTKRVLTSGAVEGLGPGRYMEISVADDGDGMNEAVRERACEAFFSTKSEGTGLGLATVYGIVRDSGGAIRIISEPRVGTTLSIFLPVVASNGHKAAVLSPAALMDHHDECVLLVEDNTALRESTRRILDGAGYSVLSAANGSDALRLIETRSPTILLTDIVMPFMSGPDLAREIAHRIPDVRVLFMSGYDSFPQGEEGIIKPFMPRTLLDVLEKR